MRPRVLVLLAASLTATAALAGCGSTPATHAVGGPGAVSVSTPAGSRPGTPPDPAAFQNRAAQLAGSWDGSALEQTWDFGYVPLGATVKLPADAFHSDADKAAYNAGRFRFAAPMPTAPAQRTIRFAQGAPLTRPGLSPEQALRSVGSGRCPTGSCTNSLTVTSAQGTTMQVRSNRGWATVPAWSFHFQGYQGAFVFAAVKGDPFPGQGSVPQPSPMRPSGYAGAKLIAVSADGRTLTLGVASGCGPATHSGLVSESKSVVVVGSLTAPGSPAPGANCAPVATLDPVTVLLSDPLGARTVLDVSDGLPLSPTG